MRKGAPSEFLDAAALSALLRRLPKADLHCHLDGSLRPRTILELGRELKVRLPADNIKDLTPHVQVAPTCRSLKEFLDVFHVLYPLLRSAAAVERISYELVEDCARDNIRHVEVRLAPALQATAAFSTDDVVSAVLKGLKRGCRDFGTTSSVIICLFRSHGPSENRGAFETLMRFFRADPVPEDPAVSGMDLAGDEARHPTLEYAAFFEEAKALGIKTTCHAGETVGTKNLHACMDLSVQRIGHGTHLLEDAAVMAEVVRRQVPLEIGLTSNVRTKAVPDLRSHPALRFHRAGVAVTLNTDDRGILGIDLTHEYAEAASLGFTVAELGALSASSVDHLFLSAPRRAAMKRRFEGEIAAALGGKG